MGIALSALILHSGNRVICLQIDDCQRSQRILAKTYRLLSLYRLERICLSLVMTKIELLSLANSSGTATNRAAVNPACAHLLGAVL